MRWNGKDMRMAGRFLVSVLIAICCVMSDDVHAQAPPSAAGYGSPSSWNGYYQPAPAAAGWNLQGNPQNGPALQPHPFPYSAPAYATPGMAASNGPGNYGPTILGTDEWEPSPLERALSTATHSVWFRVEYMLWESDEPGDILLGAPLAGVDDPRGGFEIFDPATGIAFGRARVPTLGDFRLRDLNGVRGTIGLPMRFGTLETVIFSVEKASEVSTANDLPTDPNAATQSLNFVGTSTFVNGIFSDNLELYDDSFTSTFTSKVWGAEVKLLLTDLTMGDRLKVTPLIGFQHLNIQEQLNQDGTFNGFGTQPTLLSEIDSHSKNHLIGGVIGFRAEYENPFLTLGFEPKIMFGVDKFTNQVRTNNFRGLIDGEVITRDEGTMFSPVGELGAYARVHVTENFSLHVGYNVIWAPRITRPYDNIFYNDNGPPPIPPGIVVKTKTEEFIIDGLTIGGEFRFH